MNVPEGLAQYLSQDAESGDGILNYQEGAGGNAYIDDLPQMSQDAGVIVGLFHTGGLEADSGHPYDTTVVQVLVRGTKDPRTGINKWYEIYSSLHGLTNVTLPNGDYLVACLAQQSAPIRVGPDENGRHRYSMNLRCEVLHPTEHRS